MPPNSEAKRHHRSCNLCEAMCGVVIEHDGNRVLRIAGDRDDPLSRGHICPKAYALRDIYEDPDRLKRPMRRKGDTWSEISWQQALDETADRLNEIMARHGRDAVAVYQGNPTVHNVGTLLSAPAFVRSLGTKNRYSATSVDQLPHHLVSYFLFGHQLLLPVPDIDRTHHMLILGANPLVSNGSMMSAPGMRQRFKALQKRGGTFTVVDPRRTETASRADKHHFITPGTDGLLLAALLHRVFRTTGPRWNHVSATIDGMGDLEALVSRFPAERVAAATGIAAADIERMADELTESTTSVCYGRLGVCTAEFGALNIWLCTALNIVTGNFDQPGGLMFPSPAVDLTALTGRGGYGRWRSRVRELPEFGGELPIVALAEEIETAGDGQVRALVTSAGNPVLSTPDGKRLDAALSRLDFMVSVDIYRNETTRHADIILPPRTGLEVPHYDLVFHALAVRNTARYADPLFEGAPGSRLDADIFTALKSRIARRPAPFTKRAAERVTDSLSVPRQLDIALRRGPYGKWGGRALRGDGLSLAMLRDNPHGVDLGPLQSQMPKALMTANKVINLVPPELVADFERLDASVERRVAKRRRGALDLELIGRRGLSDCNSWLHNAKALSGGRERYTLLMHPDDAGKRGLVDGATVTVRSNVGRVDVPLAVSDEVMPGVVSLPHGFGHDVDGVALSVARLRPGASINDLTNPAQIDELSGNAVLSGVPVAVSAAT